MSEFDFTYREVIPDQTLIDTWKDISLNTGKFRKVNTFENFKVIFYFQEEHRVLCKILKLLKGQVAIVIEMLLNTTPEIGLFIGKF